MDRRVAGRHSHRNAYTTSWKEIVNEQSNRESTSGTEACDGWSPEGRRLPILGGNIAPRRCHPQCLVFAVMPEFVPDFGWSCCDREHAACNRHFRSAGIQPCG